MDNKEQILLQAILHRNKIDRALITSAKIKTSASNKRDELQACIISIMDSMSNKTEYEQRLAINEIVRKKQYIKDLQETIDKQDKENVELYKQYGQALCAVNVALDNV